MLDDISHETDEVLKERAMTALGRLTLWCLRHAREPRELVERLARWLDLVGEVRRAPHGPAALIAIWRYIVVTNESGRPEELVERLLAIVGEEGKEEIVTAGEQLIERGRQQGLQQGRRELLLKLFRARFGALSDAVLARVTTADAAQLDVWAERVLTAPTLADLLGDD